MTEKAKHGAEGEKNIDFSPERAFLANELLPDAAAAYAAEIRDIKDAVKDADVVLDTNVLLIPYGAGTASLAAITSVYDTLKNSDRLYVPAQVIREFIKNRPQKIGELLQGIANKVSRTQAPGELSYPILQGIPAFAELQQAANQTAEAVKTLQKANGELLRTIRSWEWNDPVSIAYKKHLPASIIVEPTINRDETINDLQRRWRHSIPPGYKDASKPDYGIGDLLIWKAILEIGAKNKKDMIFVSGEEKADWQHRADGTALLPRFELLDEYRRASGGQALYILPLSRLLELLNVAKESVKEVKEEEDRVLEATVIEVDCPDCSTTVPVQLAPTLGSSMVPICPKCRHRFHVHRTRTGITVHPAAPTFGRPTAVVVGANRTETNQDELVSIECPVCNETTALQLGISPGSTSWVRCATCVSSFAVHRSAKHGPFVSAVREAGSAR
jgi:transposase-like protein